MSHDEADLLITNARVVTCASADATTGLASLGIIEEGAVAVRDGVIAWVGASHAMESVRADTHVDAKGRALLPGFIDPHTHLVYGGSRIDEFARKMAGEDYKRIAAEGGGIKSTVKATREASDAELERSARSRLTQMKRCGVTTVEVKSGYGLTLEDELRCLRIARTLGQDANLPSTIGTFLGAHTVPPEYVEKKEQYLRLVIDTMLPRVAREGLASSADVYIDENAFTRADGEAVLRAAKAVGLRVRAHIGQFKDLRGAELLASLGALSGDHLEDLSDDGARAMAEAGVVGVLLPGAWRTLRQTPPDVARMRAAGMRFAVGTDCNPGTSPCTDLPLCAALAVRDAGVTIEEAILGITRVAARALGLEDRGVIEVGRRADLVLLDDDDPRAIGYRLGNLPIEASWKAGSPCFEAGKHLNRSL